MAELLNIEHHNIDAEQVNSRRLHLQQGGRHGRENEIKEAHKYFEKLQQKADVEEAKEWMERMIYNNCCLNDCTGSTVKRHLQTLRDERRRLISINADLSIKLLQQHAIKKEVMSSQQACDYIGCTIGGLMRAIYAKKVIRSGRGIVTKESVMEYAVEYKARKGDGAS